MPSPISIYKSPSALALEQEADRLGELQRQIDLLDPVVAEHKVLKEKFEELAKAEPADKPVVFRGTLYQIQFGPRRNERTVTNPAKAFAALKKSLGAGLLAVLDIPLGLLDKHVPESERTKFVVQERSGWRKLDVVPLRAPAPPALKQAA